MAKSKKISATRDPVARYVDFDLSDVEVAQLKDENNQRINRLVLARQRQDDLKKAKKFEVEQLPIHKEHQEAKRLADSMDHEVQATAKACDTKRQTRLVDCYWHYRPSDGLLVLVHEESGKEIESHLASPEEATFWAQNSLSFDDKEVH